MGQSKSDLLQGTLDLLILKTLALEPMHGWGISQRIQQVSDRRAAGQPGLALPGAPPARAAGLDRVGVGRLREQPAGEVLRADRAAGASSSRAETEELGADVRWRSAACSATA